MSNGNFFSDDEPFQDIPEEVNGESAPIPQVRVNRPAPVQQSQPVEQMEPETEPEDEFQEQTEEDEDYSSVLTDARFRLEQGRLYEMIMNHDIFSGADADEKAIKYVTKQVRNFAKEQMEVMLGMRQEKQATQALSITDFPFNDLEVQTLKALASTATKGATATPEAQTFSAAQAPKKVGLNTIGVKSQQTPRPAPQAQKSALKPIPKPQAKPLQSQKAPIKRQKADLEIDQILAEEGISREEYNRVFNPNYVPLSKPAHLLTEDEIKERARQLALRSRSQVKSSTAIPMPTVEQEEMLYTQRANSAASNPQMQTIMSLLNSKK